MKHDKKLEAMLKGYEDIILGYYTAEFGYGRGPYEQILKLVKGMDYTKEDVSRFCSEETLEYKKDVLSHCSIHRSGPLFVAENVCEGLYISALVNNIIKEDETIKIKAKTAFSLVVPGHRSPWIHHIGYKHSKGTLVTEGNVGDCLGEQMSGGLIIAKGYVGFHPGNQMSGGKIKILKKGCTIITPTDELLMCGGEVWEGKRRIYPKR